MAKAQHSVSYTGDGETAAFAIPFCFPRSHEIAVTVGGHLTSASHYAITGEGLPDGGSVVFHSAPARGATIVIEV